MKIKIETIYFNDSEFGIFNPSRSREDVLLLKKTCSSYNINALRRKIKYYNDIGYRSIGDVYRKMFRYYFVVGRIVPLYQRLITYKESRHPVTNKSIGWKVESDIIIYTDRDLELMAEFQSPVDTSGMLSIDTRKILNKK